MYLWRKTENNVWTNGWTIWHLPIASCISARVDSTIGASIPAPLEMEFREGVTPGIPISVLRGRHKEWNRVPSPFSLYW